MTQFTQSELIRYSRHLTLPDLGLAGQQKLREARVLIVGAGGLGSPAAMYLAAAGVGTLGIVDADMVESSNLQRQVIHGTGALRRLKTESARERIADLNPHVKVETFNHRLDSTNALEIVDQFDIVLDGTDNFPTRYLINDASILTGTPNMYGAIFQFSGQASVFGLNDGPCYRCLFREPPPPGTVPSCAEAGVFGVLPGVIGSIQALESIKHIVGIGDGLSGRLVLFDALEMSFREIELRRDPDCAACGANPTVTELIDYEDFCGLRNVGASVADITPAQLHELMSGRHGLTLLDVREPHEFDIAAIPGSTLIPLSDLPANITSLNPHQQVIAICHHGPRARHAAEILRGAGFENTRVLSGGVDGWAREVDPDMARY